METKNSEVRVYEVTVGGRLTEADGTVKYYSGCSNEGYIYKDEDAFKAKEGVCYIPEDAFNGTFEEYVTGQFFKDSMYSYWDIHSCVTHACNYRGLHVSDDFIDHLTECVFESLDWQYPETYLNETDIVEEWLEYSK